MKPILLPSVETARKMAAETEKSQRTIEVARLAKVVPDQVDKILLAIQKDILLALKGNGRNCHTAGLILPKDTEWLAVRDVTQRLTHMGYEVQNRDGLLSVHW